VDEAKKQDRTPKLLGSASTGVAARARWASIIGGATGAGFVEVSVMTIRTLGSLAAVFAIGALTSPALAQPTTQVGTLTCDVSAGVGMILMQKQTMTCVFRPSNGAPPETYLGRIDQFGVALGAVNQGQLVWGVIAPSSGVPRGALSGTYGGVGAQATAGAGIGANVLVGGTGRAFSLQPVSIQGQTGVNIAGGVTTVTLLPAPIPPTK
jgi:hypothetical protein